MSQNDICMPKIDTQTNNWYWSIKPELHKYNKKETVRELKLLPMAGVYGVYQNHVGVESICLYVGASNNLINRTRRLFTDKGRICNNFLDIFVTGLKSLCPKMRGFHVRFFFVKDKENLGFFPDFFLKLKKSFKNKEYK